MTVIIDAANKSVVNSAIDANNMEFEKTKDTNKIISGNSSNAVVCWNTTRKFPAARLAALKHAQRVSSSPLQTLLPLVLCLLSFATVLSVLIIFMDTTGT